MRTWQVQQRTCRACALLEATVENASESKHRSYGVKYAARRG